MKRIVHNVISKWRLENNPVFVFSTRQKLALYPDDILSDLSGKVENRSRDVSTSLVNKMGPTEWVFEATGSSDIYTITVRSLNEREGDLVGESDIQISCSCPFWRYQGPEYHAHTENYLYGSPEGTAEEPTTRDPEGNHLVCKHAAAVLVKVRDFVIGED